MTKRPAKKPYSLREKVFVGQITDIQFSDGQISDGYDYRGILWQEPDFPREAKNGKNILAPMSMVFKKGTGDFYLIADLLVSEFGKEWKDYITYSAPEPISFLDEEGSCSSRLYFQSFIKLEKEILEKKIKEMLAKV